MNPEGNELMTQPIARTGPSGLVKRAPTPPAPAHRDWDLEAAFQQIRELAARPAPEALPESVRFSIDTAKGLADSAPRLCAMSPEVSSRFRLIATFLDTALTEADHLHRQEQS